MALKFQEPFQLQQAKTKEEALAEALTPAIQSAPNIIANYMKMKEEKKRKAGQMTAIQGMFPGESIPAGLEDPSLVVQALGQKAALEKARNPEKNWTQIGIDPESKKIVERESKSGEIRLVDNPTGNQLLPVTNDPTIQGRADERQDAAFKNRLNNQKNRMISDPRIKPFYEKNVSIKNIENVAQLAKDGNTIAASALGAELAKAIEGGGRLTDQDVVRYVSSGRLDRMAADKLKKWGTGTPTEATLNEILQISNVLKERYSEKIQPVYNEYIESFAAVEGMTPDEVSKKMAIPYNPVSSSTEKKATHRWNPATGKVEPVQ